MSAISSKAGYLNKQSVDNASNLIKDRSVDNKWLGKTTTVVYIHTDEEGKYAQQDKINRIAIQKNWSVIGSGEIQKTFNSVNSDSGFYVTKIEDRVGPLGTKTSAEYVLKAEDTSLNQVNSWKVKWIEVGSDRTNTKRDRIKAVASSLSLDSSEQLPMSENDRKEAYNGIAKVLKLPVLVDGDLPEGFEIKGSLEDLGGHGGTLLVDIKCNGVTKHLFLKPKDETEMRNYQVLKTIESLKGFLIPTYNEVEIQGKSYMMMDNVRLTQNAEGEAVNNPQLVDLKLAGRLTGNIGKDFHPICDDKEIQHTRGHRKNPADKFLMLKSSMNSPDYQLVKGEGVVRLRNFPRSEENLRDALSSIKLEELQELKEALNDLKNKMEQAPIAFIGSSIIFIKNEVTGVVQPLLIDPAHMQYDPTQKNVLQNQWLIKDPSSIEETERLEQSASEFNKIYFGEMLNYGQYKESNQIAMNAIIKVVQNHYDKEAATVEAIAEFTELEPV